MKLWDKNNGFDEMQMQRRNKIGHQTFVLLGCALFLDNCLYNIGVEWMDYPHKNLIIILAAIVWYTIRVAIANGIKMPKKSSNESLKNSWIIPLVFVLLVIISNGALVLIFGNHFENTSAENQDNSAIVMFIISSIGLVAIGGISIIRYIKNRKEDD